jgi:hypothetical protein
MIKQSEGHWNASKGSALQRLTGLIAVAMLINALGREFSKPTAERDLAGKGVAGRALRLPVADVGARA